MANISQKNAEAIELTEKAHTAEISGDHKQAYELYVQAAAVLNGFILTAQKKSVERRRAKLHARTLLDRQTALKRFLEGGDSQPPLPLLSTKTATAEFKSPPPGLVPITLVSIFQ
jgi:hypothetical protein